MQFAFTFALRCLPSRGRPTKCPRSLSLSLAGKRVATTHQGAAPLLHKQPAPKQVGRFCSHVFILPKQALVLHDRFHCVPMLPSQHVCLVCTRITPTPPGGIQDLAATIQSKSPCNQPQTKSFISFSSCRFLGRPGERLTPYSTVTDLARFRGKSTLRFSITASQ
jgi:hypothetical protein